MNILVFSWRDPKHPLAGGAEQSMHEHMKGWVRAGHNVTLFVSKTGTMTSGENLDGVDIVRKGYQYLGVQIAGFFYYLKNRDKFDFVVDQFHGVPFFTPLYVTKPKLAVLQEVAKEVWFKNPLPFPINLFIALIGYVTEPFIFLFYRNTQFMVGSNSAKEDLIKFGIPNVNIAIVPHGIILPNKIPDHRSSNPKIITFFGRMTADKGVMDALKVFSILNKVGDYKFYIAGTVENRDYLKMLIKTSKEMGLTGKLTFWERPTDKEKFNLFAKTFLFINPSIREGWGLVNIEANVVGTPVIAYPSPGLVDSVRNGVSGILTKTSTPEAIVREIEMLLKDKVTYTRLSQDAKKWTSSFSYTKSSEISLKLINEIAKKR